ERPRPLDVPDEVDTRTAGAQGCVDPHGRHAAGGADSPGQRLAQMGAEGGELAGLQRGAGSHGVAAATLDQAGFDGGDDGTAEVHSGHRTARADAGAIWLQGEHEGGTIKALADTAGYDADDAGVPVG